MTKESDFDTQVEQWAAEAIRSNAADFGQIVRQLPGVFPTCVLAAIQRLVKRNHTFATYLPGNGGSSSILSPATNSDDLWLPRPHPLDFDWRFDRTAKNRLLSQASQSSVVPKSVCLFGAPSLLPDVLARFPQAQIYVIDNNELVHSAVQRHFVGVTVIRQDLTKAPPIDFPTGADLVFSDPPWYDDQLKGFLWSASHACKVGALVLCSFPGQGTRPGAYRDQQEAYNYASRVGLTVQQKYAGHLRYISPPFERNALRVAGLNVPEDWRAGDLVVFQKTTQNELAPPEAHARTSWREIRFGAVRLKVRIKSSNSTDPRLRPLVPGDVLDSVSQRDPRIEAVDVWTSGNRIFACGCTERFIDIASNFDPQSSTSFMHNDGNIQDVQGRLQEIIKVETSEM